MQTNESDLKSLLAHDLLDSTEKTAKQGHLHLGGNTQNQGNVVGERPCVRQTRTGRIHEGGNRMKELLGQDSLKWNVDEVEGAYCGQKAHCISEQMKSNDSA